MVSIGEIIEFLEKTTTHIDYEPKNIGEKGVEITKPSGLFPGDEHGITFCTEKNAGKLDTTICPAIIIPNKLKLLSQTNKCYIRVNNPKSSFIDVCDKFFISRIIPSELIHPTAIIDNESRVLEKTRIGPYCVIYKSQIGRNCIIYPGVVIYHAQIGNNVVIKSGTVIGYDGFGYYPVEPNQIKKFPHYGKVVIEDDVDIGANTTIDRGALSDTIVRRGTKIDNLVHIAHGDEIGEQVIITAGVAIGGSTKVGRRTWLGIGAVIKQGISVGKKAFVAMGAVVTKDVADEKRVMGNLAIDRDVFINNLKKTLGENDQ